METGLLVFQLDELFLKLFRVFGQFLRLRGIGPSVQCLGIRFPGCQDAF